MTVIVLASSKGGVGKTTLAFNLGIHAARTAGVHLADIDPQRSLMQLCLQRRETPELAGDNPQLLSDVDTVARAIADLTASGFARDFLIVDTSSAFMNVLREALAAADVIVMPLQASPLDLMAQDALAMIDKLGRRDRLLFVLNRVDSRNPLVKEALAAIKPLSPHKPVQIANRTDYARAAVTARAGLEINRDAAAEIAALWNAIEDVLRRVGKHDRQGIQRKPRGSAKAPGRRSS